MEWKRVLVHWGGAFLVGLLGLGIGLLIVHLWLDHQLLHNIQTYLIQAQQQAAAASKR